MKHTEITLEELNSMSKNTMMEHLGIEFTEFGENYVCAKMPVDHRTHQPYGILHGGASVVLAETLGSVASHTNIDTENQICVGQEINANHIKSVRSGYVYGKATPIHIGKRSQVWEIRITSEKDELVCITRLTMAILDKKR
ncbi:MAG: hotdog fold thioesterase [Cyclobacteriaceae bacterium]|nr:hotdog fold thioesterase [Cyclobacteriaceae bacterium]